MFAVVNKNRVLVGPMDWNRALFSGALSKLGVNTLLPRTAPEPEELPWKIDSDTGIFPVEFVNPEYNKKIQYLEGPYWTFDDKKAYAGYLVKDQPIDAIRFNLKQETAEQRWKTEVSGTTTEIQGVTVTVDTDRGSRDIFVQQYLLMGDNDTVRWKFPEAWLTLTKAELGQIVSAGVAHVQAAFLWESNKVEEIDSATTLEQLDAIIISE